MRYRSKNPIIVNAEIIVGVGPIGPDGSMPLALPNGLNVIATKGMLARYIPVEGDYWVTQADHYVYLNPKIVFERKYSAIPNDIDQTIPEGFTPSPGIGNPINHRKWKIYTWTGWKGHKCIHSHSDGVCPDRGRLAKLCLCSVCGLPLGNDSVVWESQTEDHIKHWKCSGDGGTIVGQWLAMKGKDYATSRLAYSSVPGSSGPHKSGDCFLIDPLPGQAVLTYDTPREQLLDAREDGLVRLKDTIDRIESGSVQRWTP